MAGLGNTYSRCHGREGGSKESDKTETHFDKKLVVLIDILTDSALSWKEMLRGEGCQG